MGDRICEHGRTVGWCHWCDKDECERLRERIKALEAALTEALDASRCPLLARKDVRWE